MIFISFHKDAWMQILSIILYFVIKKKTNMKYGMYPVNLLLRFLLEISALVVFGYFGWYLGTGLFRFIAVAGFPLMMAIVWGVFAVPGDPSRSGRAPIPIPGLIRLLIESGLFILAFLILLLLQVHPWAGIYGILVITHYIMSVDRIKWLLNRKKV